MQSPSTSPDKKLRRSTPYTLATCVVRITHETKNHITSQSKWGESIDQTLRRIFKLSKWDGDKKEAPRGKR
jgi:hypothetical protein